ncbi:MAG: class II glutamine amidotransferase, partial [Gammaproteobacteria bacterium]
ALSESAHAHPVGDTDSEHLFCWLLNDLHQTFDKLPPVQAVAERLVIQCREIAAQGVFNMLLSDGRALYAFCSTQLHQITRRAPFGKATLADDDISIDFAEHTTPNDVVTVLATQPLTVDEVWEKWQPGRLSVLQDGEVVYTSPVA